jgi:uncharacterized protein YdhG (YjbR/CyaY superfamily)
VDDGAKRVDAYLASVPEPQRRSLEDVRKLVLSVAPDARQTISYGLPAFVVGKARVGFGAFKEHCTFFPFSGTFLDDYWDELEGFEGTKSGVHFTPERPLPRAVLRRMVKARLAPAAPKRAASAGKSAKRRRA